MSDNERCAECGKIAAGAIRCAICQKSYAFCGEHEEPVATAMRGHVFRAHPEKVTHIVDELLRSPEAYERFKAESTAGGQAELWKHFFEFADARRKALAS